MKINTYSWMTDNVVVPIGRWLTGSALPDYKSSPVLVLCDKLYITILIDLCPFCEPNLHMSLWEEQHVSDHNTILEQTRKPGATTLEHPF
jgi:hypothetical protein